MSENLMCKNQINPSQRYLDNYDRIFERDDQEEPLDSRSEESPIKRGPNEER